jgi:hypothetical protein
MNLASKKSVLSAKFSSGPGGLTVEGASMCKPERVFVGFLLTCLLTTLAIASEPQANELSRFAPMRNKDVLVLIEKKIKPDEVITIMRSSWCNFDTFPPVLQDLKRRGVPEQVLQAMVDAPYGPPADSKLGGAGEQPIYHSAEQLKQMGFVNLTPLRRGDPGGGFTPDTRGSGGILRP